MVADTVEQLAGGGDGAEGVGAAVLRGQALPGLGGGGAQRVGEAQPGLLRGQRGVLARLGRDRLHLTEPEPQQVGLLRTLPGGLHDLGELGLRGAQRAEGLGVPAAQLQRLGAGEAVEGVALRRRLQQPVLVGLAVHGDQGRRGRRARWPGPPRPRRRHGSGPRPRSAGPAAAGRPRSRRRARPPCRAARRRARPRGPRPRPGPPWRRCGPRRSRRGHRGAARAR